MKKLVFLFFIIIGLHGFAQDIHLSQFGASPLNLNPALTGLFDGDFRFVGNERTQWGSVTTPYKTISGSFDMRILGNPSRYGMLCGGIILNSDKAGDSQLGLMQGSGSLSYTVHLDSASRHFVSIGLQGGLAQRSIRYDKLIFDEQYNGDAYDPTLSSGESFSNNGYSYTDFSGGINYSFAPGKGFRTSVGAAMFHLAEPKLQSFQGSDPQRLSRKLTLHGNIEFKLFGSTDLVPSVMYQKQKTFSELIYGTNLRFGLDSKLGYKNSFYIGAYNRQKDAMVFLTGMEYQSFNVGLSYDVNTSGLKTASHNRGGLEVSIIYIIKKVAPLSGPKKPCPMFL